MQRDSRCVGCNLGRTAEFTSKIILAIHGALSPGADVAGAEPGPGADVAGASPVPAQMWQGVSPVPVQMWRTLPPPQGIA